MCFNPAYAGSAEDQGVIVLPGVGSAPQAREARPQPAPVSPSFEGLDPRRAAIALQLEDHIRSGDGGFDTRRYLPPRYNPYSGEYDSDPMTTDTQYLYPKYNGDGTFNNVQAINNTGHFARTDFGHTPGGNYLADLVAEFLRLRTGV